MLLLVCVSTPAAAADVDLRANLSPLANNRFFGAPNEPFAFGYSVTNLATAASASNVQLKIAIPSGLRVTALSPQAGWSCSPAVPVAGPISITCNLSGALASGATTSSINLTAVAPVPNTAKNTIVTATVSTSDTDTVAGNNAADYVFYINDPAVPADMQMRYTRTLGFVEQGDVQTVVMEFVNPSASVTAVNLRSNLQFNGLLNGNVGPGGAGLPTGAGLVSRVITPGVATGMTCGGALIATNAIRVTCSYASVPPCTAGLNCPKLEVKVRPFSLGASASLAGGSAFDTYDPNQDNNSASVSYTVVPPVTVDLKQVVSAGPVTNSDGSFDVGLRITVKNTNSTQLAVAAIVDDLSPLGRYAPSLGDLAVGRYAATAPPSFTGCGAGQPSVVWGSQESDPTPYSKLRIGPPAGSTPGSPLVTLEPDATCRVDLALRVKPSSPGGTYQPGASALSTTTPWNITVYAFAVATITPPSLSITQADPLLTDLDGDGVISKGDSLRYTATATNTGAAALGGVSVSNPLAASAQSCASVAAGGTCVLTFDYTVTQADAKAGQIVSTASASAPTVGPVTAAVTTPIVPTDLSVSRSARNVADSADVAEVPAGGDFLYAVTLTTAPASGGAGPARKAKLVMTLPTGVTVNGTITAASAPGAFSCVTSPAVACDFGTIPPGRSVRVLVPVAVADDYTGASIPSSAAVTTTTHNASSATSTEAPPVAVNSAKLSGSVTTDPGAAGLSGVTVTLSATGQPDRTDVTKNDGSFSFQALPAATYVLKRTAPTGYLATGSAVAGSSGGTAASDGTQVTGITLAAGARATGYRFGLVPAADVSLTGSASSPASAGKDLTYTLSAAVNAGSAAAAQAVELTANLPAGVRFLSVAAGSATCGTPPPVGAELAGGPGSKVVCSLGGIAAGASKQVQIVVQPVAASGGKTLTLTASAASPTPDPDLANNSVSVSSVIGASQAAVSVALSGVPSSLAVGQTRSFTATLSNASGFTAEDAVLEIALPGQLSLTSLTPQDADVTCFPTFCNTPYLATGQSRAITVTVKGEAAGTATVTGRARSAEMASAATATADTLVQTFVDVELVSKTASAATVGLGQVFNYVLTVRNNTGGVNGSVYGEAQDVVLSDTLPAGLSIAGQPQVASTGDPLSCAASVGATSLSCSFARLPNGVTLTVTVPVKVDAAPAGGSFANTASVSASANTPDQDTTNQSKSVTVPFAASSLSGVVFRDEDGNGIREPGEPGISGVPLTLSNGADFTSTVNSDANGAVLFSALPVGSYTLTRGTVPTGYLQAGTAVAGTAGGTVSGDKSSVSGIAIAAGTGATGYRFGLVPAADVSLTGSASGSPAAGKDLTYTLSAAVNAGSAAAAQAVELTANLPAGVRFLSVAAGSSTCGTLPPVGAELFISYKVVCSLGDIAAGGDAQVQIVVQPVAASGGKTLTLTASAASPTPDPDLANNSVSVSSVIGASQAAVSVALSGVPSSLAVGQTRSFTATLSNASGFTAENTVLEIALPGQLSLTSLVPQNADVICGPPVCSIGFLASGQSRAVTVTVKGEAPGTATVTGRAKSAEMATAATATAETLVQTFVDVELVSKTASVSSVGLGQVFNYVLTVRNNKGGIDGAVYGEAEGVVLSDTLPQGLSIAGLPQVASTGDALFCPASVGTAKLSCSFARLPNGLTLTITVPVKVDVAPAGGSFANTASVSVSPTTPDQDTTNQSKSVTVPFAASSLSGVVFRDDNRNGAQDTGEPGLQGVDVTLSRSGAADQTLTTAAGGSFSFDGLSVGTYSLRRAIPPGFVNASTAAAGSLGGSVTSDGAQVTGISLTAGGNGTGYRFGLAAVAAIALDKTVSSGPVTASDGSFEVGFALKVTGAAYEPVSGLSLTDSLSSFGAYDDMLSAPGTYRIAAGPAGCGISSSSFNGAGNTVVASGLSLAAGAECTVSFGLKVRPTDPPPQLPSGGSRYGNSAAVAGQTGNWLQDVSASSGTIGINPPDLDVKRLGITKRVASYGDADSDGVISRGDTLNYEITATNTGNVLLSDVRVEDSLVLNKPAACPPLAAGSACTVTGSHQVTEAEALAGKVFNSATAQATGVAAVTAELTTPVPRVDVSVQKTASVAEASPGDSFLYTISVSNSSEPDPATGAAAVPAQAVTLSDVLPAGLELTGAVSGCNASGNAITCALGTLPAGATRSFTVPVKLVDGFSGTNVTNTASVTTSSVDRGPQNSASAGVAVTSGLIEGLVFRDFNDNAIQDDPKTDTGIANVTVTLSRGGKTVATTQTGVDGAFSFANLAPGSYDLVRASPGDPSLEDGKVAPGDPVNGAADGSAAIRGIALTGGDQLSGYYFALVPKPDFTVSKSLSSGPSDNLDGTFSAGFTIALVNNGAEAVDEVAITDDLTAFGSKDDALSAPGTYRLAAAPVVTCGAGTAKPGYDGGAAPVLADGLTVDPGQGCRAELSITVRPQTPLPSPFSYTNTASASGTGALSGSDYSPVSGPVTVTPKVSGLGLALDQPQTQDGSGIITVGKTLRYTATVTNTGSTDLTGIQVTCDSSMGPDCVPDGAPRSLSPAAGKVAPAVSGQCNMAVALPPGGQCTAGLTYVVNLANIVSGKLLFKAKGTALQGSLSVSAATSILTPVQQSIAGKDFTKTALVSSAKRGERVPYVIMVRNTPVSPARVVDVMPPGFSYLPGSAAANGAAVDPVVDGRSLTFDGLVPDGAGEIKLELTLVVTTGAATGDAVNLAQLSDPGAPDLLATARARITVEDEAVFDCSDVIGRVFDDRNRNGYPDAGEKGMARVKLATVRGLIVTTDQSGRFSIACADVPDAQIGSNFVLKLDTTSLPDGYRVTSENPRKVRLTRGKAVKLNFGVAQGRAVALDLNGAVFAPGTAVLLPEWHAGLETLLTTLAAEPSVLKISYLGRDEAIARARLAAVAAEVSARWRRAHGDQGLVIETRIVTEGPAQ